MPSLASERGVLTDGFNIEVSGEMQVACAYTIKDNYSEIQNKKNKTVQWLENGE